MDYIDYGYDQFLTRVAPNQQGISSLAFDSFTDNLSGSKVQGGVMVSNDGKIKIDLDNNTIIISDGIAERLRLGTLPDQTTGMMVKDKDGNILMQVSEAKNIIQSANQHMELDFVGETLSVKDDSDNTVVLLGEIG